MTLQAIHQSLITAELTASISSNNGCWHEKSFFPECLKSVITPAFMLMEQKTALPLHPTGLSKPKLVALHLGGATLLSAANIVYHAAAASFLAFCLAIKVITFGKAFSKASFTKILSDVLQHINSIARNAIRMIPIVGFTLTKAFDIVEILACNLAKGIAQRSFFYASS